MHNLSVDLYTGDDISSFFSLGRRILFPLYMRCFMCFVMLKLKCLSPIFVVLIVRFGCNYVMEVVSPFFSIVFLRSSFSLPSSN